MRMRMANKEGVMGSRYYIAPEQTYTDDLLNEWREKYNVIFDLKWGHGVRVIPREGHDPLFELLCEADGTLFSYSVPVLFSSV